MTYTGEHTKLSQEYRFQAIILYDDACSLCNRFVRFVLRIDRSGRIGFASLRSHVSGPPAVRIPPGIDSVVLLEGRHLFVRSEAVYRICSIAGGPWKAVSVLRLLPNAFSDALYDMIAKYRITLFGRYEVCPAPEEKYRQRFIGEMLEQERIGTNHPVTDGRRVGLRMPAAPDLR